MNPRLPKPIAGPGTDTMNDAQRQNLRALARAATPADLSILQAALTELSPDRPTLLTTAPGSNNDKLWSEMAALGWMSTADPLDIPVRSNVYRLNQEAQAAIKEFLADTARADAMTAIINKFRADIPPVLIEAVHGVDGTPSDLAILLAGIVEMTMRRAIKPGLHDEFLREVAKVAEKMRSI
jgi:hypothetical protein